MRALALTLVLCVAAFFAARTVARGAGGASAAGPGIVELEARRVDAKRTPRSVELDAHRGEASQSSERPPLSHQVPPCLLLRPSVKRVRWLSRSGEARRPGQNAAGSCSHDHACRDDSPHLRQEAYNKKDAG